MGCKEKFRLVPEEENDAKSPARQKVHLLLNMSSQKDRGPAGFAFIQVMECTEPLHEVEKTPGLFP